MKIHIVLEYQGDSSRVIDVYATKQAAIERCVRLGNDRDQSNPNQLTYHIIQKNVKGLHGIQFDVDGKKRFLKLDKRRG